MTDNSFLPKNVHRLIYSQRSNMNRKRIITHKQNAYKTIAKTNGTHNTREYRLDMYDKLYRENKNIIEMPKDINYPMNYKVGTLWANHHCDTESIEFATMIIKNTIYVSYSEFIKSLKAICISLKNQHKKTKKKIILVIPYNMQKSNAWVSILIHPWIRDIVYDIQTNVINAYNIYIHDKKDDNVTVVVADDCSYTANQIMSKCSLQSSSLKYDGKPTEPNKNDRKWLEWNDEVIRESIRIENELDPSKFSINILIPYISTIAQRRIREKKHIRIPRNVKIFKPISELIDMSHFNDDIIMEFETTFQYHENISCIYFDHKIADAVSTFNKIYLAAPIFNCGNIKKSVRFIENCTGSSQSSKIANSVDPYSIYVNVEDILGDLSCPKTFYKCISYKLDGKKIKSSTEMSTIF